MGLNNQNVDWQTMGEKANSIVEDSPTFPFL